MHNPYGYACTIHIYRQHLTTHILHNNTYSDAADTRPTIQEMLKRNSSEYQHHLSKKEKVNRILQHQQNIRTFQTIPKRYRPTATLETISPNPTLTKELETEFQQLFFRHLNKIIIHNTITLELENARLSEIISRTEEQLLTSGAPEEVIIRSQQQFYTRNNIPENQQLSKISPTTINPEPTSTASINAAPTSSTATATSTVPHLETTSIALNSPQSNPPYKQQKRKTRKRTLGSHPNPRKLKKLQHHFLSRSMNLHLTLHNLSSYHLTTEDYTVLDKGLSFSPAPRTSFTNLQHQILQSYNNFAKILRLRYMRATRSNHKPHLDKINPTTTSFLL